MQTPWGDFPVADAHVHFFSHRFFSALQPGLSLEAIGARLGWSMPAVDPAVLAAKWAAELDRNGVSRATLIASVPGDEDSVIAAASAFPDRFYAYAMVNPCAPDALEHVAPALDGVCLFPAMHRYSIQDSRARAVIAKCAEGRRKIVFVHCGVLSVGIRAKLGLPSPFDMRFSNPIDLHAVALEFPSVDFVVPHFGAGYLREALMVCDLCPNVYLDTSSSNSWMRYLAPEVTLEVVFRRALEVVGPRRLLFGTDSSFFPRGWHGAVFDRQVAALRALRVEDDAARAILGGNLTHLLER